MLWDLSKGQRLRDFGRWDDIASAAFFPDGKQILTGESADRESGFAALAVWDVATGEQVRTFGRARGSVTLIALSKDGCLAASLGPGRGLQLWDVARGRQLWKHMGQADNVYSMAFSPDGRFLLSGSREEIVRLWHVASGKEIVGFSRSGIKGRAVAFSLSGRFVLSAGRELALWEVATGKAVLKIPGASALLDDVAFMSDGRHVLTAGDGVPRLWDLRTGRCVRTFRWTWIDHGDRATVSPDGKRALFYHSYRLSKAVLWDLETNEEVCTLWPEGEGRSPVRKRQ